MNITRHSSLIIERPLPFLDSSLVPPGVILWREWASGAAHPLSAGPEYYGKRRLAREDVAGLPFRLVGGQALTAALKQDAPGCH